MCGNASGKASFARTRWDTRHCVPLKPTSANARAQDRRLTTLAITFATAVTTSFHPNFPSCPWTATSSQSSRKRLLYSAKRCVSHGCKAHVRPAGMQQKRSPARPKARRARFPMWALYESAKTVKACVARNGARRLPTSPAISTMMSSVAQADLHRRKTHGGGRLSMTLAAVSADMVFCETRMTWGKRG